MTVPEILRAAAGEVRKGWTRFIREDTLGNVCALGALDRAAGFAGPRDLLVRNGRLIMDVTERPDVIAALARTIDPTVRDDAGSQSQLIANWNNAPDRTAADVALMLEFAALCAEQEASVSRSEPQADNAVAGDRETARTFSRA